MTQRLFLVTNDDGVYAEGIRELALGLVKHGRVVICAPEVEQSGKGHAITVYRPLRATKLDVQEGIEARYMVNGTPADCVKWVLQELELEPDLVVSGINLGANLGTDVRYSGTVSAAFEGAIQGFPAAAVSLCGSREYMDTAAAFGIQVLLDNRIQWTPRTLLNINVPALPMERVQGIRATSLSMRVYEDAFEKRQDPRGRHYFWLAGRPVVVDSQDDQDYHAVSQGFVSVSPLLLDLTDRQALTVLEKLFLQDDQTGRD